MTADIRWKQRFQNLTPFAVWQHVWQQQVAADGFNQRLERIERRLELA